MKSVRTNFTSTSGLVRIEVTNGRLRLRWTYQGERISLAVGLPESKANLTIAVMKANQIETDIIHGLFDRTLKRYKADRDQVASITLIQLFEKFTAHKSKEVHPRTLQKYAALLGHIKRSGVGMVRVDEFSSLHHEKLYCYLLEATSPRTAKELLTLVSAGWQWGTDQGWVEDKNPWRSLIRRIKPQPRQRPKPFTGEEVQAILRAFELDQRWGCYYPFVLFLFCTGTRISEAIGIRWQDLSDDCSRVWIGQSLVRGERKCTKTGRDRWVDLPEPLQVSLLSARPSDFEPQMLVFQSPDGGAIHDGNFRSRAWKPILTQLEIDYRRPYLTRSTQGSHLLDQGHSPLSVSQVLGNSPRTLYQFYAGSVGSIKPVLPGGSNE